MNYTLPNGRVVYLDDMTTEEIESMFDALAAQAEDELQQEDE